MIHYLVYIESIIEGKIDTAILWAGYGPEFRRGYGYGLGHGFVVMGMGGPGHKNVSP